VSDSTCKPLKLPSYGGQALIEGVLMRGSNYLAAAMRAPNGEIVIKTEALHGIYRSKLTKIPFLRGIVILWDALGLGTRYLTDSANVQAGSEEKIEGPALFFSLFISFSIAILLFFVAPAGLAALLEKIIGLTAFVTNLIEGLIRLVFVILYIWGVGKMPDVKRVFSYHGAEHKTINAFESGVELTPENVASFSLYHPRCGTGFVIILVIFSVILFTLLGPIPNLILRFSSRIILLPLLVMVAYEYMRFAANNINNPLLSWLSFINMKTQRLTTVEPTLGMIEVAITAFNTMYSLENKMEESERS
jgi:uncharacterized protein YqhQ